MMRLCYVLRGLGVKRPFFVFLFSVFFWIQSFYAMDDDRQLKPAPKGILKKQLRKQMSLPTGIFSKKKKRSGKKVRFQLPENGGLERVGSGSIADLVRKIYGNRDLHGFSYEHIRQARTLLTEVEPVLRTLLFAKKMDDIRRKCKTSSEKSVEIGFRFMERVAVSVGNQFGVPSSISYEKLPSNIAMQAAEVASQVQRLLKDRANRSPDVSIFALCLAQQIKKRKKRFKKGKPGKDREKNLERVRRDLGLDPEFNLSEEEEPLIPRPKRKFFLKRILNCLTRSCCTDAFNQVAEQ